MPQTRRVEGLARRYAIRQVAITLPAFGAIGLAAARWPTRDVWFWACIVAVCGLVFAMVATHWTMLRRFACPICGRRLPRQDDRRGGSEIRYYCEADDVVWQTGLHVPDT